MNPPMERHEARLKVRFRRKPIGGVYQSGEIATFPESEAHRLVVSGVAVPVGWRLGSHEPEPEPAA